MDCIFCKKNSSTSLSVEHIIPESLGNKAHTLPRGVVCDKCNNYFARKIEKPLLDSDYFIQARVWEFLPNKKGRVPSIENAFLVAPTSIRLGMSRRKDGAVYFYPMDKDSLKGFVQHQRSHRRGTLIYPAPSPVDPYLMSRFLAKVGLEVLTHKVMHVDGWELDITFNQGLDEVRQYARYGDTNKKWRYYERRLYAPQFLDEKGEKYEILHEFGTLYTERHELYVVIIILGVEYTIHMGGPEIDGYERWLSENNYLSPLYPDGPP